jgi:serine/threonine protein phosphatase PrpC
MKIHLTSFGAARREDALSQDAFETKAWDETVIAVMADGVGGARAGGEASRLAVHDMVRNYSERPRSWSPPKSLAEFTRRINHRLYHDSLARFGAPELVSTFSVAVIEGDTLYGLNIGDSRIYLAREGRLEQLSHDHVVGGESYSHVLSRALGIAAEVEPHCFERTLAAGDVALLCTDGVSNVLDAGALGTKLQHRAAARSIVAAAREIAPADSRDDMSAIVLDIAEPGRLRAVSELPLEIPETLQRGAVIEGYTLVKAFQQSDRVWLATRDGGRYTLKFAPVEARRHPEVLDAFTREMWHATRLASDFFPRAFVPPNATTRCYAMEFIEAPSLKALLRSRALAVDEAIALGRFLLGAAEQLLRLDLVHGDLKPENILVQSGYDALDFKLVDFGSVTEIFSITSRAGTASYLAPERFHEHPISERTEIFAIGVTLYEALTRAFPFGEIERFQTPHFHPAKDPARLNPNVPPWLAAVVLRATAPEPARRYQTYSEMRFELEHPERVEPFHQPGAALLERDPLRFYKTGFFVLLAIVVLLLARLLLHA